MTAALLFLQMYWLQIAGAAVLIAAVVYLGGLHARVKVQAGTISKLKAELSAERIMRQSDRDACSKIAAQLTEQQAAVERITQAAQIASERHSQAMAAAVRVNAEARLEAQRRAAEAAAAVEQAEGCEAQVAAFLDAIR